MDVRITKEVLVENVYTGPTNVSGSIYLDRRLGTVYFPGDVSCTLGLHTGEGTGIKAVGGISALRIHSALGIESEKSIFAIEDIRAANGGISAWFGITAGHDIYAKLNIISNFEIRAGFSIEAGLDIYTPSSILAGTAAWIPDLKRTDICCRKLLSGKVVIGQLKFSQTE